MKFKVSFLLLTVITIISIAGCGQQPPESTTESQPPVNMEDDIVTASAEVVAYKWASLSFVLGGQKIDVYASKGSEVAPGDVLAAISEDALPQEIILAKADLVVAQQNLEEILKSETLKAQAKLELVQAQSAYDDAVEDYEALDFPRATETKIDDIKSKLDLAEHQVSLMEDNYKRFARRPDGDPLKAEALNALTTARLTRDRLRAEYNWLTGKPDEKDYALREADMLVAKARLEDAQRKYDRLMDGTEQNDVTVAKARVKALEATINQTNLIAPFIGTVVELYKNSGESISPGTPVLLLADLSTLQVITTDLNEVDVARVRIGDPVNVSFDALPGLVLPGKVKEISLINATGSGVYYDVTIELSEIPGELRWGMSAFVEIQVSR